MRDRAMGVLFILSGLCFVAGVLNPPLLSTWGESVPAALRTASAHRTAWFLSTWLIALSVVAALAAVELLVRSLDTDLARVGRSLYLVGGGLAPASTIWHLSATSTLLGRTRLPAWYLGTGHWAAGLLLGQFAVFRGALPFPQFLAFIALGIAALRSLPTPAPPAPSSASPHLSARD
jgi:hypothetical protein